MSLSDAGEWFVEIHRGQRLGDWEIEEMIASGAWGTVYAARRSGSSVTGAALKVLSGARLTPGQRALLLQSAQREAAFSRKADHPHVLKVFDSFEVDDPDNPALRGAVVLVMERASCSLRDLLAHATSGESLPDAEAMLRQVWAALTYMHRLGWVHGDLKPGNVLVMTDGSVRLADFGLSAELEGTHAYLPRAGTTDYLPPEWWSDQATERGIVTRPTRDVWAFGVIAHQVMSGGLYPFPGATARARSVAVREYAAGARELRLASCIPAPWQPVITACLAPDHASRSTTDVAPLPVRLDAGAARRQTLHGRRVAFVCGVVVLTVGIPVIWITRQSLLDPNQPVVAATEAPTATAPCSPVPATSAPAPATRSGAPKAIGLGLCPQWWLANQLSATKNSGHSIGFGRMGDVPVAGNWNGDPSDEPGVYRPSAGNFIFWGEIAMDPVHVGFSQPGDWPIVGDWRGTGRDDVGLYRPGTGTFYLGSGEIGDPVTEVAYGGPTQVPLAGDWDGDGRTDVGVYRPGDRTFDRRAENGTPLPPIVFGEPGDIPLSGDWDGDGRDEVGVYRMSTRTFLMAADDGTEFAHVTYGRSDVEPIPLVGDWNGDGRDTQGVVQ
jgi:serine/threonine protein kinase